MEEIKVPKWILKVLIKLASLSELMAVNGIIQKDNPQDFSIRRKMFYEFLEKYSDD